MSDLEGQAEEGVLPARWRNYLLSEFVHTLNNRVGLNRSQYSNKAAYPIFDQGKNYISGYTDDDSLIYDDFPVTLFGDHTRMIKYINQQYAVGNDGIKLLKAKPDFDDKFVYYLLSSKHIPETGYNRHFKYLNGSYRIPSSKVVQKNIALVLESVDGTIDATQKLIKQAEAAKKALMRQLLTRGIGHTKFKQSELGEIPKDWQATVLNKEATVQIGIAKNENISGGEIIRVPYLRVANVQEGRLDLREVKTITMRSNDLERFLLHQGDVLLTEGGDHDKLGRGFIWGGEVTPCVHQNHIFAVRTIPERLLPKYLMYLTQSSYGKKYFLKVAIRTTNLASINSTKLKEFPIPLPPINEQKRIVDILSAIDKWINTNYHKLYLLRCLRTSLMNDLLIRKVEL